ncbi:MAG: DUF4350 domain-containing protein [Pyrinomonadaceae bacterium]
MKRQVLVIVGFAVLTLVLIVLNIVSKTSFDETPDSELSPERSSYNTGGTGTKAFFDLLTETGRNPIRWREPVSRLKDKVQIFLVIEPVVRFTEQEIAELLEWTFRGGELILISREGRIERFLENKVWSVKILRFYGGATDSYDPKVRDVSVGRPTAPSIYSRGVNAIQPSIFAPQVNFERVANEKSPEPSEGLVEDNLAGKHAYEKIEKLKELAGNQIPIVHFTNDKTNLLVELPFGDGKIVYLSDPYIVSNAGIRLADNVRLATNLVGSSKGVIAFDEYHHGYGSGGNDV